MNKQQKVFDCDLFCTEDFVFDGSVRITGNFYSTANVRVYGGLEVGGDIYLISADIENPPCIEAVSVDCNGVFYTNNFQPYVDSIYVGEHLSINFTGHGMFSASC